MIKRGNITVFTALAVTMIASFLFVLLEAARVQGLQAYADSKSSLGVESVCAEYHRGLWEKYHLLCLDGTYGNEGSFEENLSAGNFSLENVTGTLYQRLNSNLTPEKGSSHFFRMEIMTVEPVTYELLTDKNGAVFLSLAAQYMKENLPAEVVQTVYEKYQNGQSVKENDIGENPVETALNAITQAAQEQNAQQSDVQQSVTEQSAGGQSANNGSEAVYSQSVDNEAVQEKNVENPMEIVMELKKSTILSMVLEQNATISAQSIRDADRLSERNCESGTSENERTMGWYEKVLVLEYLAQHFSDYTRTMEGHALSYEMEYILCGKETDSKNLEATIIRLLLLREAANVTHILSDSNKKNEAAQLAAALAGFTANPAIIKVVEFGIVAAWAYMESMQDVRALLCGDKIALMKSNEQWTLDTKNILQSFRSCTKAKNCENGLTYQEYVKQLLFMEGEKELAYRMMELMEWNMKMIPAYKNCRMDYMICSVEYDMQYEAEMLFAGIFADGRFPAKKFEFRNRKKFSYLN